MFSFLTKKKITEERVAQLFVNGILRLIDEGFPEVAALINDDPEFEFRPRLKTDEVDKFLMIVISGNLAYIPKYFNDYQDVRLIDRITKHLAAVMEVDPEKLKQHISSYQSYCNKINHPSKNILYALSKAIFFKYELNQYQEEYFRKMNAPNPIFLKRLDEIMINFIWDWETVREKYKIIE